MAHFVTKWRGSALQHGVKQNTLFRAGPNWPLNACVGWNGGPADFARLADGYFEAGRRVAQTLLEDSSSVDLLVYPLVALYRHGTECYLKHLLTMLPRLNDEPIDLKPTHKLKPLWDRVRTYLERLPEVPDDLDETEATIQEFADIDPKGEEFRYPFANDGTRLLQETTHINVEIFAERMDVLGKSLEGCCEWVGVLFQWQMEMEAEMEAEYRRCCDYF